MRSRLSNPPASPLVEGERADFLVSCLQVCWGDGYELKRMRERTWMMM